MFTFTANISMTSARYFMLTFYYMDSMSFINNFLSLDVLVSESLTFSLVVKLVAMCEMDFHYKDKTPPINYVANIASTMQLFPPEDWLCGSSLPSSFAPSAINRMLDELTPNNIRIFWESQKFKGCTDSLEPWYKISYTMERITASSIQQWIEKAPHERLHLPARNMFIPTDLTLRQVEEKVKFPVLLRESSFSRLWYKPDTTFFTPKAYVRIDFNCPESKSSLEAAVLTDIFTRLLGDYLNEHGNY
ncbi:putative insulysin [Dioscorea sansibarensis]